MWRAFEALFGGILIGITIGIVLGVRFYPMLQPAPRPDATTSAQRKLVVVARGTFIQPNPFFDRRRYGKGKVTVYRKMVYLEPDFEVSPGPGFRVLLVPKSTVRRAAHIEGTMYIDLGGLRAFKGAQKYPVPAGVNLRSYGSLVIWGDTNKALISTSDLVFVE